MPVAAAFYDAVVKPSHLLTWIRNRHLFRAGWLVLLGSLLTVSVRAQEKPGPDEYVMRLMRANADGSNIETVLDVPDFLANGSPDWSGDGKRMAMDGWRPRQGEKGSDAQIIVFDVDGTNVRVLGDGAMPSFSPQGKRVAYSRYSPNNGIWVQDVDEPDSEPVLLDERGWGTDWSPDGTRIAYTSRTQSGDNFRIYNLVEGTSEFLFEDGLSPYAQITWNFSWSPDNRFIAFRASRKDGMTEVAVVDARGARYGLVKCFEGPADPHVSWTPDGKVMFAKSANKQLQLYTVDPTHPEEVPILFPLAPDRSINEGVFSPDGTRIAFIMRRPLPDFARK